MTVPIFQVDSFADAAFGGNPAAVCLLDGPRDDAWMAAVAREMNLSETAFPLREGEGWRLRWFTPAAEVEMCGHATLATAHVLWQEGLAPAEGSISFETLSGRLTARRDRELVELNFPATPAGDPVEVDGLAEALGVAPLEVRRTRLDALVVVRDEAAVAAVQPDFRALAKVGVQGAIVTARAGRSGADFVSRFFAPAVGIDEDPVTGSAHCCLAPYWCAHFGRDELIGYQASARGGFVRVRLDGDRVRLSGRAITVLRGELTV